MAPVYENVFISSFIYSLGAKAERKWGMENHSASINLYQQAPPDEIIGDFFANIRGKNFIIEFKKNSNGLTDELEKPQRCQLFRKLETSQNLTLANRCHYFAFGWSKHGTSQSDLAFLPYSRIQYADLSRGRKRAKQQHERKSWRTAEERLREELENQHPGFDREALSIELKRLELETDELDTSEEERPNVKFTPRWGMNAFQECILRDQIGVKSAEFKKYLQILRACVGGNKGASGIAGIVLNFSREYGVIMHKFEQIEHLLTQTLGSVGRGQNYQEQEWDQGPSIGM